MQFPPGRIRAVVFDYGNTLIEFGASRIAVCDAALADALGRLYGPLDLDRLRAIRDRQRLAPYAGDPPEYRENDLNEITADLVREIYGREPAQDEVAELVRVRFEVFVRVVEPPRGVPEMLARLRSQYRLGVLSNYPDGAAIRASLLKTGLFEHFDRVVVSGDLGYAKPHPLPFETMTRGLRVPASATVFVGDNWLADVQGGKRAGMWVVHTTQYVPYEQFERRLGDLDPDAVIADLLELEPLI